MTNGKKPRQIGVGKKYLCLCVSLSASLCRIPYLYLSPQLCVSVSAALFALFSAAFLTNEKEKENSEKSFIVPFNYVLGQSAEQTFFQSICKFQSVAITFNINLFIMLNGYVNKDSFES